MSFKENFEKKEEDRLDYDDSAFYIFFIALLTCLLIPFTYNLLKTMIHGEMQVDTKAHNCKCPQFQKLLQEKEQVARRRWQRKGFYFKLVIAAFLWYVWFLLALHVNTIQPMKAFDPFEILGLEPGADAKAIKKAYRAMSLEKHPDKNPDDPLAVTEFIQITKAYSILTDETARTNFEKYGNPDGPGNYQVAIALPRFLLEKEYQVQVLVVFFVVLLVIIPMFFYINLDNANMDQGVDVNNIKIYQHLLNENMLEKNFPAMLANSIEFQNVPIKSEQQAEALRKIKANEEVKESLPKENQKNSQNMGFTALLVILGYLHNLEQSKGPLKEQTLDVIRRAPNHIEMMINTAMQMHQMFKMRRSPKRITAKNILQLIQFSQKIVIGTAHSIQQFSPFYQLPGFDHQMLSKIRQQYPQMSFDAYCKMEPIQRQSLKVCNDMKTFYLQETVIQGFPLINLSVEAYTEGEKEVVAGDIITIKIKITQLNVPEGKHMGYVYSNRYPFLKKPQWYLLATDDTMTNIVAVEKIYLEDRVFVKEIRDRTQKPGTIQITVSVLNDSYRGFDQFVKVRCTVLEHAERQVITYDQEDLDAKKEPSVMAQMMDQGDDSSSEEEEEQDEKAELQKKLAKAGIQPTSAGKKKQVEAAETTDEKTESTTETKKDQ